MHATRKAPIERYAELLDDFVSIKAIWRVGWDQKSYGFALVVPTAGGKFRLTLNPTGINKGTKRVNFDGGYMLISMIKEAQMAGRRKRACKFDWTSAFNTFVLGPKAQELSTFTTPLGKYRCLLGYFGWHSFSPLFQQMVMQKVVLPLQDKFGNAVSLLAWLDDEIAACDDERVDETLVDITLYVG